MKKITSVFIFFLAFFTTEGFAQLSDDDHTFGIRQVSFILSMKKLICFSEIRIITAVRSTVSTIFILS